jgi:type I restriction enzyme R subunit
MEAQERLADEAARDHFAREFLMTQALYEFLEPDTGLSQSARGDYRWVAKVYQSVQPAITSDALLWQRLGAKTHELIAQHIGEIEVGKGGSRTIVLDGESLEQLKLLGLDDFVDANPEEPPTAAEVIDSIRKRLDARLNRDPSNPRYRSLAERLESLRQTYIETAEESVEYLKRLLELARELVQADKEQVAEEGAAAVAGEVASLLPDQRIGALTQIFEEYRPEVTPDIVERVVHEIDAVVTGARFLGWQTSREGDRVVKFEIRKAFKKYGLEPTGELFDRAYAYVAEHY